MVPPPICEQTSATRLADQAPNAHRQDNRASEQQTRTSRCAHCRIEAQALRIRPDSRSRNIGGSCRQQKRRNPDGVATAGRTRDLRRPIDPQLQGQAARSTDGQTKRQSDRKRPNGLFHPNLKNTNTRAARIANPEDEKCRFWPSVLCRFSHKEK